MTVELIVALALAYLLGSISFAILVSKTRGLADPRGYGSGNPGATNVLRSGDKFAALLTLLGDALKGTVAILVATQFSQRFEWGPVELAAIGLSAFLGHLFPIFHRFQGGKGVATAAGVLLAINLWLGLSVLGVWIAVAFLFKISSLAALSAAVLAPVIEGSMFGFGPRTAVIAVMSALLIWRHQSNIQKLLNGTEGRMGKKKSDAGA